MAGSKKITLKKYTDKSVVVRFDIASLESLVRNKYINMKSMEVSLEPKFVYRCWLDISYIKNTRIKGNNQRNEQYYRRNDKKNPTNVDQGVKSRVRKSISTVMKKLKKLHEKQMKIENIPIPQRKSRKSATSKSRNCY